MKTAPKLSLAFLTALFCMLTPAFGQTTLIQPGQQVVEKANPMDIVPDENVDPRDHNPTPTPDPHDINANDTTSLGSQDTKTIYDRNSGEKEASNQFTKENRGRINYGKRAEQMVVSQSSRPVKIQKTKDGSSDASEGTGVFKDSLLDSGLGFAPKPEASPAPSASPRFAASPAPKPRASVAPKLKSRFDPAVPDVDLSLGIESAQTSPAPSASPNP